MRWPIRVSQCRELAAFAELKIILRATHDNGPRRLPLRTTVFESCLSVDTELSRFKCPTASTKTRLLSGSRFSSAQLAKRDGDQAGNGLVFIL
jgi:hypothetical protein